MPSHDQQHALPFGYAFEYAMQHQSPDRTPRPPGPPLLNDQENELLGNFFNDPDAPGANSNPFAFTFDLENEQGADLSWAIPDIDNAGSYVNLGGYLGPPHYMRSSASLHEQPANTSSRQQPQHLPLGNHGLALPLTNLAWDEGHMGASALLNLSQQNSPGVQRQSTRSSADLTPTGNQQFSYVTHATHMLQTGRYMPANGEPISSGASTPGADALSFFHMNGHNSGAFPSVPSRTAAVPRELVFDTDQNFRYPSNYPAGLATYAPVQPYAMAEQHPTLPQNVHNSLKQEDRSDVTRVRSLTPARSTSQKGKQSVPQRTAIPNTEKTHNRGPATKRRRTQSVQQHEAVQATSSPAPAEVRPESIASNAGSAATSPANSNDETPGPKSAAAASNGSKSNAAASRASASASATKRQKLTEEQRKRNHIISEQRRRGNMKDGYAQLDQLVPSLRQGGLSKSQVLQQTVHFLGGLVEANKKLASMLQTNAEVATRTGSTGNGARSD